MSDEVRLEAQVGGDAGLLIPGLCSHSISLQFMLHLVMCVYNAGSV